MPPHLEPLHKALAELESDSGALALVRSGFLRFMESVIQAHETSEPVNPPRIPWPLPDRALGGDEAAYLLATLHDALVIDGPRLARLDREPASPGRSFALAILEKQRLDFTATVESPERRPVLRGDVARLSGLIVRVSLSKPGGAPAEQAAPKEPAGGKNGTDAMVRLDQAAALVGKSKRTLKKHRNLPKPDYPGRGRGKAHQWKWSSLLPFLRAHYRPDLPERFPGSQSGR